MNFRFVQVGVSADNLPVTPIELLDFNIQGIFLPSGHAHNSDARLIALAYRQ